MNVYNFRNKIKRCVLIFLLLLITPLILQIILKNACDKYASNLRKSQKSYNIELSLCFVVVENNIISIKKGIDALDDSKNSSVPQPYSLDSFSSIDGFYDREKIKEKRLILSNLYNFNIQENSFLVWKDKTRLLLDDAKIIFSSYLSKLISFDSLSFLTQLTLGYSSISNKNLDHLFKDIGILHLLVISGSHFTVLTQRIDTALAKICQKKFRNYLLYSIIFFYCCFVGWSSSVIRSFIFFSLVFCSKEWFMRRFDTLYLFGLGFMIHFFLFNDQINDLGFQLSYLASLALIFSGRYQIREANVIVMAFISPVLIFYFGEINFGTLIFTYLLSGLINYFLELGLYTYLFLFLTSGFDSLEELVVLPFLFFSKILFHLMKIFALFDYSLQIDSLKVYHFAFYYILLALLIVFFYYKKQRLAQESQHEL